MRPTLCLVAAVLLAALSGTARPAVAETLAPPMPVAVTGFEERDPADPKHPAENLSGIACRPEAGGGFDCLVVDDEARFAQRARLAAGHLIGGRPVTLIGATPPGAGEAFGSVDAIGTCRGGVVDNFEEFDGEGVAWLPRPGGGGSFFVVGSHGCARRPPLRMRQSTHLLARIDVDAAGQLAPTVLTWRLAPSLSAADRVGRFYNQPLTDEGNGLDIEGIAAIGGDLLFGLRAPLLPAAGSGGPQHAFILRASAASLFSNGAAADTPVPMVVGEVTLPAGHGVRDLSALPDGRLVILSGPAHGEGGAFALHVASPGNAGPWPLRRLLASIDPPDGDTGSKAEGVAVLTVEGRQVRLLVLFEKPGAQGAREYRLLLD